MNAPAPPVPGAHSSVRAADASAWTATAAAAAGAGLPRVGCDVVDVARLAARLDRRPRLLARVFTDHEVADARRGGVAPGSPTERARLAARFAAKEAARKALGDLRLGFHATEVRTATSGAPRLYLHGRPADAALSLSHDAGIALAVVVLADDPPPAAGTAGGSPGTHPIAAAAARQET